MCVCSLGPSRTSCTSSPNPGKRARASGYYAFHPLGGYPLRVIIFVLKNMSCRFLKLRHILLLLLLLLCVLVVLIPRHFMDLIWAAKETEKAIGWWEHKIARFESCTLKCVGLSVYRGNCRHRSPHKQALPKSARETGDDPATCGRAPRG